jgi:hypothetical protein
MGVAVGRREQSYLSSRAWSSAIPPLAKGRDRCGALGDSNPHPTCLRQADLTLLGLSDSHIALGADPSPFQRGGWPIGAAKRTGGVCCRKGPPPVSLLCSEPPSPATRYEIHISRWAPIPPLFKGEGGRLAKPSGRVGCAAGEAPHPSRCYAASHPPPLRVGGMARNRRGQLITAQLCECSSAARGRDGRSIAAGDWLRRRWVRAAALSGRGIRPAPPLTFPARGEAGSVRA